MNTKPVSNRTFLLALGIALGGGGGCTYAPLKPCTSAGSFDTVPMALGDMQCNQRKNAKGDWVNHGKFKQFHPNELLAIEGEFRDGVKVGTWRIYNDKGEQTTELNYNDKGVLILGGGGGGGGPSSQ